MPPIYPPLEDSLLLSQAIEDCLESLPEEKLKTLRFLDMGCGSGIQSEKASQYLDKINILASDINEDALKYVKKLGFPVVRSDLFSNIKGKFDLIAFNPPYLPKDEFDQEIDTTGGEKGDEIALSFITAAKNYLSEEGKILLLISSLTPTEKIEAEIRKQNMKKQIITKKKLFFEELKVWLISKII